MRPLNKQSKKQDSVAKAFWDKAEREKKVERVEETVVFHLTQEEAEKCRYELLGKNTRMVECVVHRDNFSHGIRMFPPINWELIAGIPYYRKDKNSRYERWFPNLKENLERFS